MSNPAHTHTLYWAYPPRIIQDSTCLTRQSSSSSLSQHVTCTSPAPRQQQQPVRSTTLALDKAVLTASPSNLTGYDQGFQPYQSPVASQFGQVAKTQQPVDARIKAKRTKTVQDVWFGVGGGQHVDEVVGGGGASSSERLHVKDKDRTLTIEWAKEVCLAVSLQSGVMIDVEIVVPTIDLNQVPPLSQFNTTQHHQQLPRFLFKFQGTYAKVLFAKSALRRNIMPEHKAEVSFPLTQIYNLSALYCSQPLSRAPLGAPAAAAALSPQAIIPDVRSRLNDIAVQTGVLLTIDDPAVLATRQRMGSTTTSIGGDSGSAGSVSAPALKRGNSTGSNHAPSRPPPLSLGRRSSRNVVTTPGDPVPAASEIPAAEAVVMDSPESIHVELPNVGGGAVVNNVGEGAGVIGQKPPSRQASLDNQLVNPPTPLPLPLRSATSSRFFPAPSDVQATGISTPSPTASRFFPDASSREDEAAAPRSSTPASRQNSYGFTKEGTCTIVIQGLASAVAAAKTLLLVLSDELSGLFVEKVDIHERLHRILAGRKNGAVNHLMSITETNIYLQESSQLVPEEDEASYGSKSPIMSPPLRFSPQMGSNDSRGPGSPGPAGLGAGFGPPPNLTQPPQEPQPLRPQQQQQQQQQQQRGAGGPVRGIPGLTDPTVPDLTSGLGSMNISQPSPHPDRQAPHPQYPAMQQSSQPPPPSHHHQPHPHQHHMMPNGLNSSALYPHLNLSTSPNPMQQVGGLAAPMNHQPGWGSPGPLSPGGGGSGGMLGGVSEMQHKVQKNMVYITGTSAARVLNAKEWLMRLAFEKNNLLIPFQTAVGPRKLDWLIHEKSDQVIKAMYDNGCTVKLLPGSQIGLIQVLGDHEVSIRRTMKQIIKLLTETCLAAAWMIETPNVTAKYDPEVHARKLAIETDVEMAAGTGCIEAFSGTAGIAGIRRVLDLIETPSNMGYATHVQFQVQPLNEHQDFLAGKGMGKIVSMSRKSNAKIQLVPSSDYLFTLDIRSDSIASLAIALGILQEELPAEKSFYLPETFHRKIIGRNGKNIQDIMYRHNVAVRFSSKEQWAEFGGHQENEDNVLIITPAKNASVIETVKNIVMDHVPEEARHYAPHQIQQIPRSFHAAIQASPVLQQCQEKYGAAIRFLPRERGSDSVEIYAASSLLATIEPIIRSLVPVERLSIIRSNVHPTNLHSWPSCVQSVLDSTATTVKTCGTGRDDRLIGLLYSTGVRNMARLDAAKQMVEKFLAERQQPETPSSFSLWGNEAPGPNSIMFSRGESEPPVQYENRNFRSTTKNGKTGSLDPSMTVDWMERAGSSSPFQSIPEESNQPQGLAQRLRASAVRTQSLDVKTLGNGGGGMGYQPTLPSTPSSSQYGSNHPSNPASSSGFPRQ